MKTILCILMLFTAFNVRGQWDKRSIPTYSLCFAAGFSDGLNDCIIANKFYYAKFWGYADWQKHGNIDGFHVTKGMTYVFYSGALALNIGERQNWKRVVVKGLVCLAISRGAHELCYNVIFNHYPK